MRLSFKVLVVLQGAPCPTPFETVLGEKSVAEVLTRDFRIGCIFTGIGRTDLVALDVWIVARIDIHGETHAVLGDTVGLTTRHDAEIETRGIVGRHGTLVIGIVIVYEHHAHYAVMGIIELTEDVDQIGSNGFVAYHLAYLCLAIGIAVEHTQVAQR